jgi:hypothetical protein
MLVGVDADRRGELTEESNSTHGKESQDGADTFTARDDDSIITRRLATLLANGGLNIGSDVPRVEAEAGGVGSLAGLDDGTGSVAAGLVDSGALNSALLIGATRLAGAVGLGARGLGGVIRLAGAGAGATVVAALGARVLAVLADSGLDEGGNIPRVVAEADGVLLLADLDVVAVNGAALIVDSGALDTALLLMAGAGAGAGAAVIVVALGTRVLAVLADSGLDEGGNIPRVVAEADGVLLLADGNIGTRDGTALIIDSSALDAAFIIGNLNLLVAVVGLARVSVLADSRLLPRDNNEGVVSKADGVLLLANFNVRAGDLAALVVDSGALDAALLNIDLNLGMLVGLVVLGVVVRLAVLGLVLLIVRLLVLADRGDLPGNDGERVVAEADSVLLLADSDISTGNSAALIVDGGALEAAVFGSVVAGVVARVVRRG